jgi:sugar O-acyltransferase (sialic acid O-acetyltransferase NeuD family)
LVIFGSGGISREVAFVVEEINESCSAPVFELFGFVESENRIVEEKISGYEVICSDDHFPEFAAGFTQLGVVVPFGTPSLKRRLYEELLSKCGNLVFPNIIHPSVSIRKGFVKIGVGNVFTYGCRLTTEINIGNFNLFNLNSTIGHDVVIGDFCVINPLVAISGGVRIENDVLIGTGANILQRIILRERCTVGAGAVVTKDVSKETVVVGVPAKPLGG